MALDESDLKTIDERILTNLTTAFEVPEGKTLTEHLAEVTAGEANKALNGYDKRTAKTRTALEEQIKTLNDEIASLKSGGGEGGEGGEDEGGEGDSSKLSPEVRKQIDTLTRKSADLEKKLEEERKARETEADERKKIEEQAAARALRDETQRVAIGKDIGVDPERVEFLLDHLTGRQMLRANDAGGYEFLGGKDKYSGEDVWVPLADGLKEFVKGPGKMFLPAVQGSGGGSQVTPGGSGGGPGGRAVTDEELAAMKPSEIEAAAKEGRIKVG